MAPVALAALPARLVVVGGLARAGKSSAAQVLKEVMAAFGRTAHLTPLDSWRKPMAERAEGTGVAARYDVDAVLAAIKPSIDAGERRALQLQVYDRACRTMYERRAHMSIGPDDLLIVGRSGPRAGHAGAGRFRRGGLDGCMIVSKTLRRTAASISSAFIPTTRYRWTR